MISLLHALSPHLSLSLQLTHTGDQPTGSLVLPVRELLSEPGLVLDRWLSLDGVPPESQILLRAELKVCDTHTKIHLKMCAHTHKNAHADPGMHRRPTHEHMLQYE